MSFFCKKNFSIIITIIIIIIITATSNFLLQFHNISFSSLSSSFVCFFVYYFCVSVPILQLANQLSSYHLNKKRTEIKIILINETKLKVNKTWIIFFSRETNTLRFGFKLTDSITDKCAEYLQVPDFRLSITLILYFRTITLFLSSLDTLLTLYFI
jgi:hypothetical protein